ncbi:MAG: hypothetical protein AAF433_03995 [Bacteroidota bacterium]
MKSLLFIGLLFSLFATAIDAQRPPFGSSSDLVLNIPSSVFSPVKDADHFKASIGQGGAYFDPPVPTGLMTAPLNLPVGARITGVRIYTYDSSSRDMVVSLHREQMNGIDSQSLISYTTSGSSTSLITHNQRANIQIEDNWGYYIRVQSDYWEGSNLKMKGVRLTYQLP